MATYGEMKSRIMSELNRDDLSRAASAAVQTSIKYYETQRFWFNEQRAQITSIESQEFYRLPSDFVMHDSLSLVDGSNLRKLYQIDYYQIMDMINRNPPTEARPTHYDIYSDQIRLYPTPDSDVYIFVLSYVRKLDSLLSDSAYNEWTNTAEALIRSHAMRSIAGGVLHDPQLMQVYDVYVNGEYKSLRNLTNSKTSSGKVRKYNYPI